jgi:predicted nucleic acid-binding protein
MITAVDTNVLLDVFSADPTYGSRSKAVLRSAIAQGSLIACEVVWAEIASVFPSSMKTREALTTVGVHFSPIESEVALQAGEFWRQYRRHGGTRIRIVADFLIAAHALTSADCLLTRDRGFYRKYFTKLRIVDPTHS